MLMVIEWMNWVETRVSDVCSLVDGAESLR